jgi:hypothetical protein
MLEQVTGAGTALVIVLGYLLIAEAMTAAVLLLGQFIVVQVRALVAIVEERPEGSPEVAPATSDQGESYRVGGGLLKW